MASTDHGPSSHRATFILNDADPLKRQWDRLHGDTAETSARGPIVSIVVVNYNGGAFLWRCLDSAIAQTHPGIEILMFDNQSTDGSYEQAVREYGTRVLVVRNGANLGFPSACNKGASMCRGEYVIFMNNDAVLHARAVEELVRKASAFQCFDFFQPKILLADSPEVINSTGISIHYCGFGVLNDGGKSASQCTAVKEISGVHGACFMARLKAFRDVGTFDGAFFSFYEDTDLSWRLLLRGRRVLYVPSALVYHKWGQAWGKLPSAKLRLAERNRLIMVLTNYHRSTLLRLAFLILCTEIAMLAWVSLHAMARAKIRAYVDLILSRKYLRARRRMIQSMRFEGDAVLLSKFTSQLDHARLAGSWLSPIRSLLRLFEVVVVRHL